MYTKHSYLVFRVDVIASSAANVATDPRRYPVKVSGGFPVKVSGGYPVKVSGGFAD
jgi:hypothetical protein